MNKLLILVSKIRIGIPKNLYSCLISLCGYVLFVKTFIFLIDFLKKFNLVTEVSPTGAGSEFRHIYSIMVDQYIFYKCTILSVFVLIVLFVIKLILQKIKTWKFEIKGIELLNILFYLGFIFAFLPILLYFYNF